MPDLSNKSTIAEIFMFSVSRLLSQSTRCIRFASEPVVTIFRSEFANVFSRYGSVVHCVILATVDNSSRRRGFVVMSSHEEAKLAITSLTRTQIKYVESFAIILHK